MRASFLCLGFVCCSSILRAQQPPEIEWQRCFGTANGEEYAQAVPLTDGGFLLVGSTSGGPTGWNGLVIRTDETGNTLWSRTYGGSMEDKLRGAVAMPGGGFMLLGFTTSNNGDVSGNHGQGDVWLVRINSEGSITWQKCIGGPGYETSNQLILSNGGDLLISCTARGAGDDVPNAYGNADAWLIRADTLGTVLWSSVFGGSSDDLGGTITEVEDHIIYCNATRSADGQVEESFGNWDIWVLRINGSGELQNTWSFGGSESDGAFIVPSQNGGFLLIGSTESNDGMITAPPIGGTSDIWLCWLDSNLSIVQQMRLGGLGSDSPTEVLRMPDDGWLIGATVSSDGGDVTGYNGGFYDIWAVRLDAQGVIQWQRTFGGSSDDRGGRLTRSADGGVLMLGISNSSDGDVTSLFPGYDIWAVKFMLDPTSIAEENAMASIRLYPNPCTDLLHVVNPSPTGASLPWRITDAQGRTVLTGTLSGSLGQVPVATLVTGPYTVGLEWNGQWVTAPFVKE